MKNVLEALSRREEVLVIQRGKVRGRIIPEEGSGGIAAASHPFFGSRKKAKKPVEQMMQDLRKTRNRAI
jgi:hypothetical protein